VARLEFGDMSRDEWDDRGGGGFFSANVEDFGKNLCTQVSTKAATDLDTGTPKRHGPRFE
jgi:hypothetical protein